MNCLILGAGLMQKPAILSAREAGYKTVVVDADPSAVCIPLADKFFKIDLKDKEGILELAEKLQKEEGLACVFTAGTDFSASVSYVCEKLNLNAHSYDAALNASVKTRMRKCFADNKVPSPKFLSFSKSDLDSVKDDFSELLSDVLKVMDYPFVIKPVDNMGARGCRMVRKSEEFGPALKDAVKYSRTDNAIVEEYMDGPEFSIDALVVDGTFTVTGFAERHIKYPPYFIEVGHTMPAVLDKKMHDELISVFASGAKALGLTCGAAKADIKYTKNGPMIGEIAGRLSGGYMSGWTYPYASDLNLTKQALLIACGKTPEKLVEKRVEVSFDPGKNNCDLQKPYELFEIPCVRTCAERAWISIPGTVEYVENIKDYTDQAVRDFLPRATVEIGGKVDFPRNNVEKCGNVISVSASSQIAVSAAEDAVSNVFITLKPKDEQTEKFLYGSSESDEENFPPSAFGKLSDEELNSISGTIEQNKKTTEVIPEILKQKKYSELTDWNYNTILSTAQKFDELRANHPELDSKKFWKCVMRGGLQAAVYYSDSVGK